MASIEERERALKNRLKELDWKLVEIESALDVPGSKDSEERAIEREGDEVLERLGKSGQEEERMIFAALRRISEGTYGVCAACGEEIGVAPSGEPNSSPSLTPSGAPSKEPSLMPSVVPSDSPTVTPSSLPPNAPSEQPSHVDSQQPSSQPSTDPSPSPSGQPSSGPSEVQCVTGLPIPVISCVHTEPGQVYAIRHYVCSLRARVRRLAATTELHT